MARPRSNSDPSETKAKAPLAPTSVAAKNPLRAAIHYWDKKSQSGYVGLSNQGATCYLNSLLQCLYMTPEFRHSLFAWQYKPPPNTEFKFDFYGDTDTQETDTDSNGISDAPPEHSIPYQLQCLFARLHHSCRGACSTKPLTKSFHWDDGQAFQQHDVQELLRVLFDAVSRALSRVGKGDLLNDLCKGVLLDYLDCQACHSDRSREDIFLDLSLTIDNLTSLEDAIQKFITPEIMSEGNQVNCYQCNKKQDFKKGLKFKKLPSLMVIQLKRFMFNWEANRRIKLSHKVTFPKHLDMTPYIDEEILKNEIQNVDDLKYSLYGVIIQSGGALGGHYYAYIQSFENTKWYVFNDSSVRELDEKNKEFDNAFGGENIRGTGYVLLYRQTNLKLPKDYGYFPAYMTRMIAKEDEMIKIQWQQWQKEMRTITIYVSYPKSKLQNNDTDYETKSEMKSENENIKYTQNGTQISIKVDVEEYTFESLLKYVRNAFGITESEIPLQNSRLRKYYPDYDFVAEGFDDAMIQRSKIETAKWPKRGTHLRLEIKSNLDETFAYFDPNSILISMFVVTDSNTEALVNRGFVQSATFKEQDLPPGDICSVIVDSTAPLSKIKPILFGKLCESEIVPKEWLIECGDISAFNAQNMNIIKFDYQRIRLFTDDLKSLTEYNIKLGTMVFVELKSGESLLKTAQSGNEQKSEEKISENENKSGNGKSENPKSPNLAVIPTLNPSYQRSKLAVLYEEQRLKISVQYNEPLPAKSAIDRVEELLMTPQMLRNKRQMTVDSVFNKRKRLEFNYAVRISKECPLGQLKLQIANELKLDMSEFRLRKSSHGSELRDMHKTLHSYGITEGGLVYVEYGVPTGPKQVCINFALYDVNKLLTDPHKKKKTLAQKLFEYPFRKDIKVCDLKTEIVKIVNRLFPLYRNQYNFIEAIKVLKREERERNETEIENLKKATQNSINKTESVTVKESKTETQSETEITANDKEISPKRSNLFGIEYVRLRKKRGAKVIEMLLDNRTLSKQMILGSKDSIELVIEKIEIPEHFTKNHICFWAQKYKCNSGKAWNGKIFRKKEFVIDKNCKMRDLKALIARLLKKSRDKSYSNMSDAEIIKNISVTKGFSTSPMRLTNIDRLQWPHRVALTHVGVSPDAFYYKTKTHKTEPKTEDKSTENKSENSDKNPIKSENNLPNTDTKSETENKSENSDTKPKTKCETETNESKDSEESESECFRSYNGKVYTASELIEAMQTALCSENESIIGRPPFHLRNGDLLMWTDIKWRPNKAQIAEKHRLDLERLKTEKNGNAKGNKNRKFKASTLLSKFRREPEQLKIRTYDEYMRDEQKKKENEAKELSEKSENKTEKTENENENENNNKDLTANAQLFNAMVAEDVNDIENPKPKMKRGGSF